LTIGNFQLSIFNQSRRPGERMKNASPGGEAFWGDLEKFD
jgi:hypothetical protein